MISSMHGKEMPGVEVLRRWWLDSAVSEVILERGREVSQEQTHSFSKARAVCEGNN